MNLPFASRIPYPRFTRPVSHVSFRKCFRSHQLPVLVHDQVIIPHPLHTALRTHIHLHICALTAPLTPTASGVPFNYPCPDLLRFLIAPLAQTTAPSFDA